MSEFGILEQRAISLATVLITRDPDARIIDRRDSLYDLEIELMRNGRSTGRLFGLELKARNSLSAIGRMTDDCTLKLSIALRKSLGNVQAKATYLPYPLLYLVFSMDSDRGYFGWLREPTAKGKVARRDVSVAKLWGKETHRELFDQVNRWYQTRETDSRE